MVLSGIPPRLRGVRPIVTKRGARDAVDASDLRAILCTDERPVADGEVVWSWHPWAGVKSCGTFRKATVTNKVMDTGESTRISVKTIAQGMSMFRPHL